MTRRVLAMIGATLALSLLWSPPASAAPVAFSTDLTGSMTVSGETDSLPPGSRLDGTFDPDTGALVAEATFPESSRVSQGATVVSQIVQIEPLTATVDPATGQATGTSVVAIDAKRASAFGQNVELAPCRIGPISLNLTGTLSADGTLQMTDPNVTIPPTTDECGGVRDIVNAQLAGSGNAADLVASGLPVGGTAGAPTTAAPTTPDAAPSSPGATPPAAAPGAPASSSGALAESGLDLAWPATVAAAAALLGLALRHVSPSRRPLP